ncbi:MAG: CoA-binding protein [Chloroflexota bacterium]
MTADKTDTTLTARILNGYRTVAVVGASPKPDRPSYRVASYLLEHGYRVIPVNPSYPEVLGQTSYPEVRAVPEAVEVVDIFQRPEAVMPVVEQAIAIGAKVVWMQEGIVNEAAAAKAREAGLLVVMDRCMRKEHERLTRSGQILPQG